MVIAGVVVVVVTVVVEMTTEVAEDLIPGKAEVEVCVFFSTGEGE